MLRGDARPYDHANGIQPGGDGPGGGVIVAALLSRYIKPGTVSRTPYNHYSMLASVESLFGLKRLGEAVGVTPSGPTSSPTGAPDDNDPRSP